MRERERRERERREERECQAELKMREGCWGVGACVVGEKLGVGGVCGWVLER